MVQNFLGRDVINVVLLLRNGVDSRWAVNGHTKECRQSRDLPMGLRALLGIYQPPTILNRQCSFTPYIMGGNVLCLP